MTLVIGTPSDRRLDPQTLEQFVVDLFRQAGTSDAGYMAARDPGDTVHLKGDPPITATIRGLHGDAATAAIAANVARVAPQLPPGLRTMLDVQPVRAPAGHG